MSNSAMNILIAQSPPTEGQLIRRTIEVEQDPTASDQIADTQASSSVFYGVGAIILVVIACGAIAMYWKSK